MFCQRPWAIRRQRESGSAQRRCWQDIQSIFLSCRRNAWLRFSNQHHSRYILPSHIVPRQNKNLLPAKIRVQKRGEELSVPVRSIYDDLFID